jgi:hypothetical protein
VRRPSTPFDDGVADAVETLTPSWVKHRTALYKQDPCLARQNEATILRMFVEYHLKKTLKRSTLPSNSDRIVDAIAAGLSQARCEPPALDETLYDRLRTWLNLQ